MTLINPPWCLCLTIIILILSEICIATPKPEPFVLHILPENFHTLNLGYEAEKSWAILKSVDLSKGTFRITASDIDSYDPERQTFTLLKETSKQLLQDLELKKSDLIQKRILKDPQFPATNLLGLEAFVVYLDGKPAFGGIFIEPFSAMTIDYSVIYSKFMDDQFIFRLSSRHRGPFDLSPILEAEKVRKIFGDLGKLVDMDKNGRDAGKVTKIKELELNGEGYISVGGGCFVYLTGKIIFKPEGELVAVTIDNSGGYFGIRANDQPIKEFKIILPAHKIEPFFIRLKSLLAHPIKTKMISTRNAMVHISLPFKTEKLEALWREIDRKYAMDPLLKEIENFVMECYKNPDEVPRRSRGNK